MSEKKDNKKFSRRGRRFNGRYLKTVSPYISMMSFLMPTRNDALVSFKDTWDITETEKFIREKRTEGMKGLGMLHIFIAAYVRAISQVPSLNRFVNGQRLYARTNIEVVMSVKREMTLEAEETSIKVKFEPTDTVKEVYEKLNAAIDAVKKGEDNDTDVVARTLMKLPRGVLRAVVAVLRFMDYYGLLPKALLEASPFHGSMIVTDVASLGIPPVSHHIYNFGNLPVFTAFGAKYRKYEVQKDGTVETRRYIDYNVVIDERICDGFAYARGARILKACIKDPRLLETPPETVVEDIV